MVGFGGVGAVIDFHFWWNRDENCVRMSSKYGARDRMSGCILVDFRTCEI